MRGITALAVLALVGPVFAQGERAGPPARPRPDARRGGGIEKKLEEILHRLERLEQRVEERDKHRDRDHGKADGDREYKRRVENLFDFLQDFDGGRRDAHRRDDDRRDRRDRARRHDRDERSPRRGPGRRDGSRRGDRRDMRPDRPRPQGDKAGPDAAVAQFRRLMQAAQKGDPRARKMLEHMYKAMGKMFAEEKKAKHKIRKKVAMATGKQTEQSTLKIVTVPSGQYKVVTGKLDTARLNTSNRRREAAIKLMKIEAEKQADAAGRFRIEREKVEELQRAARIAELRAQAVRLQKEIEMLKRALAK